MSRLNTEIYSIFNNINKLNTATNKKEFKKLVRDFLDCICELHNIERDIILEEIENKEDVFEFLVKTGIMKDKSQFEDLKEVLKKEFKNVISIISIYSKKKVPLDNNLKKFMDHYRREEVNTYLNDKKSPTVVDFFCGAGGMSLGFHQNGYRIVLANDIEKVCTETYSFNHYEIPKNRILNDDIKNIIENIDNIVTENVNVVIGGPPCQGFSMAGARIRNGFIDDPRNYLFKHYFNVVKTVRPKVFIMENVKGIMTMQEGKIFNEILRIFSDEKLLDGHPYTVYHRIVKAIDFGIPQKRERMIIIGTRKKGRLDLASFLNYS